MRPYVELPGLSEIVLEESYVLDVRAAPGELILDMEFVVTRDHPAYTPPPPSEVECFRRGSLRFTGLERLVWDIKEKDRVQAVVYAYENGIVRPGVG